VAGYRTADRLSTQRRFLKIAIDAISLRKGGTVVETEDDVPFIMEVFQIR
jgi:hypothetical protein